MTQKIHVHSQRNFTVLRGPPNVDRRAQIEQMQATLLAAALVASYSYYTAWVVLTPFVDREVSWFHDIFPDRYYALAVPTALMVAAVAFVFGFVGIVHLRGGDGES